jgi:hypothetical protein
LLPQNATLVNPEPRKGIYFFARIVEVLFRKRPDIPLLVVEGAPEGCSFGIIQ